MPNATDHFADWRVQLAGVLCLALGVRLATYGLFAGLLHPDEVFQYTEQAHRLVFGEGLVPWEYRAGIRSWLFPGLLAGVLQAARLIGDGPAVQNAAVAIFLALLCLPSVACCMLWGRQAAGTAGGVAAGVLAACWSDMVLMSIHPLLDGVGTDFLIPGVFLLQRAAATQRRSSFCAAGAVLGLALVFRLQLAPAIGWALLRLCGVRRLTRGAWAISGLLVPVLLSGVLDWITLGSPFQSVFRYASLNLHGVADFYGISPWYTYLIVLPFEIGWVFPPMAVCLALGAKRLGLLAELAFIILVTFSCVPHKEARFLFPMFPFLMALAGAGSAQIATRLSRRIGVTRAAAILGGAWMMICGFNAPFAWSAGLWLRGQAVVREMHRVSDDPGACGLAIIPPGIWYMTGGRSHLRPGLPLLGPNLPVPPHAMTGFDYAMAFETTGLAAYGMTLVECRQAGMLERPGMRMCLWRNPGRCKGAQPPALAAPDQPFRTTADSAR